MANIECYRCGGKNHHACNCTEKKNAKGEDLKQYIYECKNCGGAFFTEEKAEKHKLACNMTAGNRFPTNQEIWEKMLLKHRELAGIKDNKRVVEYVDQLIERFYKNFELKSYWDRVVSIISLTKNELPNLFTQSGAHTSNLFNDYVYNLLRYKVGPEYIIGISHGGTAWRPYTSDNLLEITVPIEITMRQSNNFAYDYPDQIY
jgi:hypothetical protein